MNTLSPSTTHTLLCHPATPPPAGMALSVNVRVGNTGVVLAYTVDANTERLRIPPLAQSGPADGLWQHTCFEAFVATDGETAYREFNFSPSGQWAAYRFASERMRVTDDLEIDPPPATHISADGQQLTLNALLPWTALPLLAKGLNVALSAVIEEANGRLSYWALQHPCQRPDFHHPAGRALRLAFPQN